MNKQNGDSIYKTPEANLLEEEELPTSLLKSNLSYTKLLLLFWLSLLYLLATLPLVAISFMSGVVPDNESYRLATDIVSLIDNLLYLYLLYMFKLLLNYRLACHSVDNYIYAAIILSLIMSVISYIMPEEVESLGFSTLGFFVLMVPLGVVNVIYGIKLLKLQSYFSYLRLYAWSTIVAGIFLASVVLFLFAIPAGMVSSFAMAMMFHATAKELRRHYAGEITTTR
ncbi:MAG: hypothetical protein JAY85_14785 [Candidatus Thiodiazotropha weberae]|uniref:Uncharacterized protein n=1 Tax=Candidatus Thiodiazotropha endoloripes TaxID=1818881 RepID=A0A1E2USV3_9GAMM|nr:hypothetical protein [Candidatus Thiodiazotropha endoloripes]MCG7899705.1 hypothetical protein [Candidatus Thiodiazotropha weberae]MCG7901348.1 hypothetical protein [Candidatus Thiodiazotropha weberae]MCG7915776.1 hypothetical protein [Candidatus Thiodiazotropha weberae]ODB84994.1 hypothetical protein A3194_14655 [Candidatus Thiodiazotropha endoloripes]ODB86708.1 hypothetical protein A3195_14085 [Candidatus Thiodiazotropha endoloripes]